MRQRPSGLFAAIDGGLNFMDNSWDYNDGQSEIRVGKALRDGYRQKAFLNDEGRWPNERSGGTAD